MLLHPGQVVLGHTVAAFHKQGGSGIVYSGTDSTGNRVAIKFIRTDGAGAIPAELEVVRFVSEHPHPSLVRILRYGAVDGGHAVVMEWADESLQDRLDAAILAGEPMSVRKALGLVKRVAAGLDYLDTHKYAHHDVKPGNVLLVDGRPKLSDFGFAQLASASLTSMSMSFKGTPHYLAPEVCDNRSARNRSDQYSLAVMYYWLRRNASPYRELRGQVELSPVGLIKVHTSAVPDLEGLTDGERVAVAKALSKNPQDRFPTCSAFVSELIRTVHVPRATARPTKPWRRKLIDLNASVRTLESVNGDLRSRARRERRWRFALLGLLVLGLCGLGWLGTLVVPSRPDDPAPPTRAEFDRLTAEVARKAGQESSDQFARQLRELDRGLTRRVQELDEELARRTTSAEVELGRLSEAIAVANKQGTDVAGDLRAELGKQVLSLQAEKREVEGLRARLGEIAKAGAASEEDLARRITSLDFKGDTKLLRQIDRLRREAHDVPSEKADFENLNGDRPPLLICTAEEGVAAETVKAAQKAWAKFLRETSYERTFALGGEAKIEMVLVPPGKYFRGSPPYEKDRQSDEVQRLITITKPLWVGKYEVTRHQFFAVVEDDENQSNKDHLKPNEDPKAFPWVRDFTPGDHGKAVKFCDGVTKVIEKKCRLLTEAEWEYAYRAGTRTPFYFGVATDCHVVAGKKVDTIQAIGSLKAGSNGFGIFDMAGNVWEWCADWHDTDYYPRSPATDPLCKDKPGIRVVRGGSAHSASHLCRAAGRVTNVAAKQIQYVGFRVCIPIDK